ncbi:MAG: GTPase [Bacilli bacterium]
MNDKTCSGCGVTLQSDNTLKEGYTNNLENDICMRCFRMRNYGDYQVITKSNDDFIKILEAVNETKDLVLYIVDILNIGKDLNFIKNYITNNMILIINKRDVIPKSVKDEKLIEYIKGLEVEFKDIVIISCEKNYNIDVVMKKIKLHKSSRNVYVIGFTNTGKSSLINKIIKNYSTNELELTISPLPTTTLNKIVINIDEDLTLIDTPGLVDRSNIVNYVDKDVLKKINAKKEIKPKTFQIKKNQSVIVDNLLRVDYIEGEKNSFTIYMSNSLKISKINSLKHDILKDNYKQEIDIKFDEDLVISGLGFIKIVNEGKVSVYLDKNIDVYTRDSLI